MASGITNKGKYRILGVTFRAETPPTNFYVALATSAVTPDADTNTFGQLTEIANGNGYTTGGYQLSRNSTDFPDWTEVDASDWATLLMKDIVWTASGGNLPGSGAGARWAALLDDNVTVGSREVWAWYDLTSDRTVSNGQTLTLADTTLKLSAPA
jgi:hypothetical protein